MIRITGEPILPAQVLSKLKTENSGSVVLHVGIVRPSSEGRRVVSIEYQGDVKQVERELFELARGIQARWEVEDVALCRRLGQLGLGEVILVATISAPHRKEAFQACQQAVEGMRNMKSIMKKELLESQ